MSLEFLLEIGSEEIPDWMIPAALEHLAKEFAGLCSTAQLQGEGFQVETDATPRRLVLRAVGLIPRQADREEWIPGPAKSADLASPAVAGFARKHGIDPKALESRSDGKNERWGFRKQIPGAEAAEVLAKGLPALISGIPWPKTMYWTGKGGARFIRPVRWLVAILGDQVVPFEFAGVSSGATTQGHRRLGAANIAVTIADHETRLRENFVILKAADRRARILNGIGQLGVSVKPDEKLLDTLVYITEYPACILGSFERQYLSLPREVLVTVMRHHQKYFSVENAQGELEPNFIAVMNTADDPEGWVRKGNERVLRARFNDARFFWDMDQQKTLAQRIPLLANVTFQARLGSYLDKTKRVAALVRELGGDDHALRAAELSKTDLTTEMVKEFTDLQGVIGGLYAKAQDEPEPVWRAIYEHYKPLSMEDSIPASAAGRLLSLADKIDTLRGCFEIGLAPTGSKDPFALRRAAQGVVKILVEGQIAIPLRRLTGDSKPLEEFFLDRLRHYFREVRGFRYDEVNAVLAAGFDLLSDVEARLIALSQVRPTADFEPLAASFKRIQNILKQASFSEAGPVDETLLEAGPETDLYTSFTAVRDRVHALCDYAPALAEIASLRPAVDLFFDKVLVNAPETRVRQNRLTLLHHLRTEFSTIADFSEIVTA
jgi:glycyl-tRNA synthetase beta chain